MLSVEENELLSRTNRGTPMGELLRRYWVLVVLSRELPGPDSPPVRLKIMGEKLVAFRTTSGTVGIVQDACPHRRASLFWGRNEEEGIRCVYHGWKFDVEGNCTDMPSEPDSSNFKDKIKISAYPTAEAGQVVWAYMGPKELMPASPPHLEWARVPDDQIVMSKRSQETNWAQAVEGGIDSSHISFLHSGLPPARMKEVANEPPDPNAPTARKYTLGDTHPVFTIKETEYGMLIGARRNAEADSYYWRITQFLQPWYTYIPGATTSGQNTGGHAWVPMDDEHCWVFSFSYNAERPITEDEKRGMHDGSGIHAEVDERFRPIRNSENDYMIDREAQAKENFTGIKGIGEQDMAVQEAMGPIVERPLEHLGTSDLAIIGYRRQLIRLAKDLANGKEPYAPTHPESYHVRSVSAVLGRDEEWFTAAADRLKARV